MIAMTEDDEDMKDEEYDGKWQECGWDDNSGAILPVELVKAARQEEMEYLKTRGTYQVVDKKECFERTGKRPISTRWVDCDKSHGQKHVVVRSRLVARDFKNKGDRDREDLFCATPPLELLRFLVSRMVTCSGQEDRSARKMMFIDVKTAHLIPRYEEDVYVELPEEAKCQGNECGSSYIG